jgi:ADP-ribosyl-[dinitrogen reductase] hydrolase
MEEKSETTDLEKAELNEVPQPIEDDHETPQELEKEQEDSQMKEPKAAHKDDSKEEANPMKEEANPIEEEANPLEEEAKDSQTPSSALKEAHKDQKQSPEKELSKEQASSSSSEEEEEKHSFSLKFEYAQKSSTKLCTQRRLFDELPFLLYHLKRSQVSREFLSDYSIFPNDLTQSLNMPSLVCEFSKSKYAQNLLLDRAIGSIMGMAIGDSLGHLFEFTPVKENRNVIQDFHHRYWEMHGKPFINAFRLKPGQWTDDCSMGLCLADSLIERKGLNCLDLRKRFMLWWYFGYNNAFRFDKTRMNKGSCGLGGNISWSLSEFINQKGEEAKTSAGDKQTSGNGSLMRLTPVALYYHDNLEKAILNAGKQSRTTHMGTEAKDCSKIMAFIIHSALNHPSPLTSAHSFLSSLDFSPLAPHLKTSSAKCLALSLEDPNPTQDRYNKTPADRSWNWKSPTHKFSPTRNTLNSGYMGSYAMDGLTMALHCVYNTESFCEAILKIVNLGGDADTTGSICGQIAGAIYGISAVRPNWARYVMQWDNGGEIALRAFSLLRIPLEV